MGHKNQSRKLARKIFWSEHNREDYRCPDCGRARNQIYSDHFEVHHIDGDPYNNSEQNLVALCRFCHNVREDKKPSLNCIQHFRNGNVSVDKSPDRGVREIDAVSSFLFHELETYDVYRPKYGLSEKSRSWLRLRDGGSFRVGKAYPVDHNTVLEAAREADSVSHDIVENETEARVEKALSSIDYNYDNGGQWNVWLKKLLDFDHIESNTLEFTTMEEDILQSLFISTDMEQPYQFFTTFDLSPRVDAIEIENLKWVGQKVPDADIIKVETNSNTWMLVELYWLAEVSDVCGTTNNEIHKHAIRQDIDYQPGNIRSSDGTYRAYKLENDQIRPVYS